MTDVKRKLKTKIIKAEREKLVAQRIVADSCEDWGTLNYSRCSDNP